MYFERDWMMRQIQMLTQFVARTVFDKDYITYQISDEEHFNDTDELYNRLREMMADGNICAAEDVLYESFDGSENYLLLAAWFYSELNKLPDDALQTANFSRDEIDEGLRELLERYHITLPPRVE